MSILYLEDDKCYLIFIQLSAIFIFPSTTQKVATDFSMDGNDTDPKVN